MGSSIPGRRSAQGGGTGLASAAPRCRLLARVGLGGALVLLLGACGARSGFTDGGDSDGLGGDDDMREGSCAMPIELPFAPTTVRGRLVGGGSAEGWCGDDGDLDRGREDTYLLTTPYSTDVILTMRDGTDIQALLRVNPSGCDAVDERLPEICVVPDIDDPRHFWAEAGQEYYISVDSPPGSDGRYELDIAFGWPPLEACDVHPTSIAQEPGGFFLWENNLGSGQGRVDGACGGPGRENMFLLEIKEPSLMTVVVESTTIRPIISVRSNCAAASEINCVADEAGDQGGIFLEHYFEEPGNYYLAIDQADVAGGDYLLQVSFN